jgi:drug/metabolite transporter (DMT)-like permease
LQAPPWPGNLGASWAIALLLGFAVLLLVANFGLQYGAARLPAGLTAVIMLSEVVFATASTVLLGQQSLSTQVVLGGVLIMLAALLSTRLQTTQIPLQPPPRS